MESEHAGANWLKARSKEDLSILHASYSFSLCVIPRRLFAGVGLTRATQAGIPVLQPYVALLTLARFPGGAALAKVWSP